jgi:hypothetical protein
MEQGGTKRLLEKVEGVGVEKQSPTAMEPHRDTGFATQHRWLSNPNLCHRVTSNLMSKFPLASGCQKKRETKEGVL